MLTSWVQISIVAVDALAPTLNHGTLNHQGDNDFRGASIPCIIDTYNSLDLCIFDDLILFECPNLHLHNYQLYIMKGGWNLYGHDCHVTRRQFNNCPDKICIYTGPRTSPSPMRHTLQWRHNGRGGVSNHQPHDCLLNRLFRCRSKT